MSRTLNSKARATFGQRVRELRVVRRQSQRTLAAAVGVSFTYISRIENETLDFGPYPSEELILKLADALTADPDELLLLAKKIPERIRKRVLERPDVFRRLAELDDIALDRVLAEVGTTVPPPKSPAKRRHRAGRP